MEVETLAQSRFFADNFNDVLGDESRNEKYFFNPCVWLLPGGASRKAGWGYAAHFPTLLPYLWLKSGSFPTLFMIWLKIPYLFMTVTAGAVALNISYDGILLMVLLIIMEK